ncbi:alpha/beta hydrolase [Desulforhabdus amnigena]|uniref:Alpha/beta hydrolase n=1 Tax=Desulforhabdus amnigena TaxID=40218 RepID=A0A9W6D341_9BACT|nr:hypothetical protein [Desulforhabdus amnigena]GLI34029.1 alpha/beta hydrolase [Desulforhabdus amnigena]
MSEKFVKISAGNILLEAFYDRGRGEDAAVLHHPLPLYGGSMDNNVVLALQKVLSGWGWSTLRFNFRSVGRSGGNFNEKEGDVEDALAAAAYLRGQGHEAVHLAGYSYGAWIVLKAIQKGLDASSLVLVSPPLDFLDFKGLELPSKPCLITLGENDDFCSVASLEKWLKDQPGAANFVSRSILPQCDHFYWGVESRLSLEVKDFLQAHFHSSASEKSREPGN